MNKTLNSHFQSSLKSLKTSDLIDNKFRSTDPRLNMTAINPLASVPKKPRLLQINTQKIKKNNQQLIKLFKPPVLQTFDTSILQKSKYMYTNQIFKYLVNSLKKQRQGIISFLPQNQRKKQSTLIQNKIRQFLFNSLQQSLLMSQKQLSEVSYFQRLFSWFTDVFKQRQMKLEFKKQSTANKDPDACDEDWIIRNGYQSNMPLEINNYQRKMLSAPQFPDLKNKAYNLEEFKANLNDKKSQLNENEQRQNSKNHLFTKFGQKKLYAQTTLNSPVHKKSNDLLPLLNRSNLFSNLNQLKKHKEKQELSMFQSLWKKQRSHYFQHSTKKFYNNSYKKDKTFFNQQKVQSSNDCKQFKLNKKTLDKINAARLGITLTEFRKNKQNVENDCFNRSQVINSQNSKMFHPNLSSNYFYDIKKNKVEKGVLSELKKKNQVISKKTQQSQGSNLPNKSMVFQQEKVTNFQTVDDDGYCNELVDISGFGLTQNSFYKSTSNKTKKK